LAAVKIVTVIAIALGLFFAGYWIGAGVSQKVSEARLSILNSSNADEMLRYAAVTHALGTSQAYEEALHELLRAIEAREKLDEPGGLAASPLALSMDKVLTYARLALLATERNDPVSAARYWSNAQALCPALQWTSCTPDRLTGVLRQLDEHSVWNLEPPRPADHGS
jgi:hypothetical protein